MEVMVEKPSVRRSTWYNEVCRWLRMEYVVYGDELKNIIERFIQSIKDRMECFDDYFPRRKDNCKREYVHNRLKLFVLYLHLGRELARFMKFITIDGGQANGAPYIKNCGYKSISCTADNTNDI